MNRRSLHVCAAVLPLALVVHAAVAWLVLGGARHGNVTQAQHGAVAMQLVALVSPPKPVKGPESPRAASVVQASRQPPVAPPEGAATVETPPGRAARSEAFEAFKPPADLERTAVPRSAPDVSMLEGLSFSGWPMRLRLYVDSAGRVVEVVVLQAVEDDEVLERVRSMFLSTGFIAGRSRGEDVASYKDVELALGVPR